MLVLVSRKGSQTAWSASERLPSRSSPRGGTCHRGPQKPKRPSRKGGGEGMTTMTAAGATRPLQRGKKTNKHSHLGRAYPWQHVLWQHRAAQRGCPRRRAADIPLPACHVGHRKTIPAEAITNRQPRDEGTAAAFHSQHRTRTVHTWRSPARRRCVLPRASKVW